MGIFNSTFRQHIKDELDSRKFHHGRQQVYHPTARVTSLIQGSFSDPRLRKITGGKRFKGFTLGPQDPKLVNSLDKLTNMSGNGSVVGITYTNGVPEEVRVKSKKNLPSPGVTDISISTQSKGGLVFKAIVNFKFYGKEQYDVLYQTFMRPGNAIVLEYGHTHDRIGRADRTKKALNDLDFFRDLEDSLEDFIADLRQTSKFPATRSRGTVVGLVSNFKISLNEENEYEASIDLINALEFMYTLPPEDTFLSYSDPKTSNSIKNNFGLLADDEQYKPKWDRVFQSVLKDLDDPILEKYILSPSDIDRGELIETSKQSKRSWFDNIYDPERGQSGRQASEIVNTPHEFPENHHVSLNYIANHLIPRILRTTIDNDLDCNRLQTREERQQVRFATQQSQVELGRAAFRDGAAGSLGRVIGQITPESELSIRIADQQQFDETENFETNIQLENIGYWPLLRSSNTVDVIINNENLYLTADRAREAGEENPTFFTENRIEDYAEKFDVGQEEVTPNWFKVVDSWSDKELYRQIPSTEDIFPNKTSAKGIFVNYEIVRKSFFQSNSVSEAITRILNAINSATNNILKLKLRMISSDESGGEQFTLTIYDENVLPSREQDILNIYKFFEDDNSEAISYSFDFSLPATVAATVIANNFDGPNVDAVGESEANQLIRNGYDQSITSLVEPLTNIKDNESLQVCGAGSVNTTDESDQQIDQQVQLSRQLGVLYSTIVGYRELSPPSMKSRIINDGLFNTLPTSATVSIKLVGVDGFRFGDMFSVQKVLPAPYDKNNIFMLTGYKHDITSEGWTTTIDGIMIASTPVRRRPRKLIDINTKITDPVIDPERGRLANPADELKTQTIIVPDIS